METVYETYLPQVQAGLPFHVDFNKRELRIGNTWIIKNGTLKTEEKLFPKNPAHELSKQDELEYYYQLYAHSSASRNNKNKMWFKPMDDENLSEDDILYGDSQGETLFTLSMCLMDAIFSGEMQWCIDDMDKHNHFFWRSPFDNNFIILRKWIINNH